MKLLFVVAVLLAACRASSRPPSAPRSSATPAPAAQPVPEPTASMPPPPAEGSRALFVVVGYGNPRASISLAEVARDYCAGKLPVVADVRAIADEHFDCTTASPTIASLRELVPHGPTAVALTDLDHLTAQWKALAIDGVGFFEQPATYPLVRTSGGARPVFAPRLTHLVMTGVTAITRGTGAACDAHGIDWLTANLRPHFATAQYVHVSNEVSITPDCEYPLKGSFVFCTKAPHFEALRALRANLVELTGNHNRDFGDGPFLETLAWYRAHGMQTFGGGATPEEAARSIVVPLADGKRLGLVGFNETCPLKECARDGGPGANAYGREKARAAIKQLRERADFVIATVQWQEHDSEAPTRTQGPIARDLVDFGADLVLGSQAHQLQVVEFYRGKPIFYGLGNLLFDQVHRLGVRQAFFLHHYFFEGRLVQSIPVFTWIADDRQPGIATPEQAAEMRAIALRDELLYEGRAYFPKLVFPWH